MAKYHVNPKSGEAGVCKALAQCPFGAKSDHHDSLASARNFYEAVMSGESIAPLSWLLSARGAPVTPPDDSRAFIAEAYRESESFRETLTDELAGALDFYSMGGYESVNATLRGLSTDHWGRALTDEQKARAKTTVALIDKAFEKAEVKPRRVYRYASVEPEQLKTSLRSILNSGVYRDQAYMSTSLSSELPLYNAAKDPTKSTFIMEIVATRGVPLQKHETPYGGRVQSLEAEFLLPRSSEFEVVGLEWRKKVVFGELKELFIRGAYENDTPQERKIRTLAHATVPVLKMVQKPT